MGTPPVENVEIVGVSSSLVSVWLPRPAPLKLIDIAAAILLMVGGVYYMYYQILVSSAAESAKMEGNDLSRYSANSFRTLAIACRRLRNMEWIPFK